MPIRKDNIEEIFPMSDVSKGMIYHTLKNSSSYMFHEQSLHILPIQNFNPEIFEKALGLMINKHENLRSVFNMFDFDQPLQIVLKSVSADVEFIDIQSKDRDEQKDFIENWLKEDRSHPFDLKSEAPLWKVQIFYMSPSLLGFAWITHHAIMDGWSTASLITEINNTYWQLLQNANYNPGRLRCSYKDFIVEQIQEKNNPANLNFWREKLDNAHRLNLPFNKITEQSLYHSKFLNKRYKFGTDLLEDLKKVAVKNGTTLKDLCFAAYLFTFYYFSDDSDILVGFLSSNRPAREDGDKLIGCFLNTLPFRYDYSETGTWDEYAKGIHENINEYLKHGRLSFLEIVKGIEHQEEHQNPLFDVLFNFTDFYVYDSLDSAHTNKQFDDDTFDSLEGVQKDNMLITFLFSIRNGFSCKLLFYDAVINGEQADRLMDVFRRVLHKLAYHGDEQAIKQNLFTSEEIALVDGSTDSSFPLDATVYELVSEQMARFPDKPAICFKDTSITYAQLNERVKGLAGYLQEQEIASSESVIGIYLDRSIESVIAMLAVVYAGGSYLTLGTHLPAKRVAYMTSNSNCKYVISDSTNYANLPDDLEYIKVNEQGVWHEPKISSESKLYTIYTSGSTGNPKGVMVTHRNVINLIYGLNDIIYSKYDGDLSLGLLSSFDFDASVQHLYGALMLGHTLHIAPDEIRADSDALVDFFENSEVQISDGTPTHLRLLMESEKSLPNTLKHFLIAGEVLPISLLRTFTKQNNIKVTNLYGPTETCVDSTYFDIIPEELTKYDSVPIGRPLPNEKIYIMSKDGQLQGIGVPGEIVIDGEGVSLGYQDSDLTQTKFLVSLENPDKYMYRTGDIGRFLPDGNIEFIGRKDEQIKLRGYRIELGEVNGCIQSHHNVKHSVTQLLQVDTEEPVLCAFVEELEQGKDNSLAEHLKEHLPLYMVPSKIVKVKKWPYTSAGKLNIKELINNLDEFVSEDAHKIDEEFDDVENQLAEIWKSVLNVSKVGLHEDFFTLGGDSIKLIKLLFTIKNTLGIQLSVQNFYGNSTIKKLSNLIKSEKEQDKLSDQTSESDKALEDFKSDFIDQL